MKPAGAIVRMTARHWDGPELVPGAFLSTARGRVYEVVRIHWTRGGRPALTCIVRGYGFEIPHGAQTGWWKFNARGRKRAGRAPVL